MAHKTLWQAQPWLKFASVMALATALASCDQPAERAERAHTVVDAALDQIRGSAPPARPGSRLDQVSIEDRAFASRTLEPEADDRLPAKFAVGSIIAKPIQLVAIEAETLQEEISAVVAEEPDAYESAADTDDDLFGEIGPDGGQGIRAAPPRGLPGAPPRLKPVLQNRAAMRASRKLATEPKVLAVQLDARSRMYERMNNLGLEGTVRTSKGGHMVIDLFADATQFGGEEGAPFISDVVHDSCPENVTEEQLRADPALATECLVQSLQQTGEYEYCERDFIFEHQFARRPADVPPGPIGIMPNDPLWDLQWHFQNNGTGDGRSIGGTGFVDFWTRQGQQGSKDVVVAVVDTGLALSHPDIAASTNVAPGWDLVTDPAMGNDGDGRDSDPNDPGDLCNPNAPLAEDSFHGTHVAGTIGAAASNNGSGVAGGNWNVTIVPVRALGKCGGRLSDINDAIRWAGGVMPVDDNLGNEIWNENPADIINLSIGLFERCPASLQDSIDTVVERGAVVVAAAGNARLSTEFYSPGGCRNVITVAAGDARGFITPYSNYGVDVDVLAPGGDLRRDDDGDGRPDGVLSTKPSKNCIDPVTGNQLDTCYYAYEQGTSMAAPHVSAALALIAAKFPDSTGAELETTLMSLLDPRSTEQCASECSQYPGSTPIPDQPGMCTRPCGGGWLNLENLPD
ncbi:MAG: S8 family serine peptidase [Pseudomonadota bacterium]